MRTLFKNKRVLSLWLLSLFAGVAAAGALYAVASAQHLDPAFLTGDSKGYALLAQNLLQQGVFSAATTTPLYPESFRAPGYPLFLAALYAPLHSWVAVLFVQVVLLSVAPVLLYLLFRSYHERAAFWGSVLFALEPMRLFYSASLLSDALFACMLLGALLLLERPLVWWYAALCGALLGASILVRPIAIALPVLVALYLLWRSGWRVGGVRAAALCAAALLVVLPWSLRNHALYGSYQISSVSSYNLMLYNAPEFLKAYPSEHAQAVYEQFQQKQQALPREQALSLARAGEFSATFREVIAGQELRYGIFHLVKTAPFFLTDGLRDTVRLFGIDTGGMPNISTALLHGQIGALISHVRSGGTASMLFVVGVGFWTLVTLLWLWSTLRVLRGEINRALLFFAAVVLYFALLTGPVSNARYRLPVEGILLVSAAVALYLRGEERQSM